MAGTIDINYALSCDVCGRTDMAATTNGTCESCVAIGVSVVKRPQRSCVCRIASVLASQALAVHRKLDSFEIEYDADHFCVDCPHEWDGRPS